MVWSEVMCAEVWYGRFRWSMVMSGLVRSEVGSGLAQLGLEGWSKINYGRRWDMVK